MTDLFSWRHDPRVDAVVKALAVRGEARFVGGCVRDSLLGLPPGEPGRTDIDMATVLLPQDVIDALSAASIRSIPTGLDHGTVTAVVDSLPIEITTLRSDVSTDGRRATVAFTDDWTEDAARRDFTINALYLSDDGGVFDPTGGREDLSRGVVRFIGDPTHRIQEDYLRIVRFLRFSGRFASSLDPVGWEACVANRDGIGDLSKERIWQEISKTFSVKNAPMVMAAADAGGLLDVIVPASATPNVFAAAHRLSGGVVSHALGLVSLWPAASRDAVQIAFKPPTAVLDAFEALPEVVAEIGAGASDNDLLYRFGNELARDGVLLSAAKAGDADPQTRLRSLANTASPIFPIKGRDFLKMGMAPGKSLGVAMGYAEQEWISAGYPVEIDLINQIRRSAFRQAMGEDPAPGETGR